METLFLVGLVSIPFIIAMSGRHFGWASAALIACGAAFLAGAVMPFVALILWGFAFVFAVLSRAARRRELTRERMNAAWRRRSVITKETATQTGRSEGSVQKDIEARE
jgi:hypothetical protein